jgi:glycosyltransferase involved in cell wall biosynthesis
MRIAIIKRALHLPARTGSDLHTSQMAQAWIESGHSVDYFAWETSGCDELPFPVHTLKVDAALDANASVGLNALQRRICRYMGTRLEQIAAVARIVNAGDFDVCVAGGQEEVFYLPGLKAARVWYLGDECVFAALSQLRTNNRLRQNYDLGVEAVVALLIEAMWRKTPEAFWAVSETDRKWMEAFTRRPAEVIANGVDLEFFRAAEVPSDPQRMAFWGRLDYGPNEQGLEWFLDNVWGPLRSRRPDAKLSVIGFSPSERVRQAVNRPGVELMANVPDLRPAVCAAPIAIYPFVSGGGIRNKLLEGAAMARALVVSPRAIDGLPAAEADAWTVCRRPEEWVEQLIRLFDDRQASAESGRAARRWVESHYTWKRAAALAEAGMLAAIEKRRARRS